MSEEHEQQIRERLAKHQHVWNSEITYLFDALDATREREKELRKALQKIASCESIVSGDVVDIARTALRES